MDFLSRGNSPVSQELWQQIDDAVVKTARGVLVGRRVLPLTGPLGIGVGSVTVDDAQSRSETYEDGFIHTHGRRIVELATLYQDFSLYGRDLAQSEASGYPADLSQVMSAAQAAAIQEDRLIFQGQASLNLEGLFTAQGANRLQKSDWSVGENAFADVSAAINTLVSAGVFGDYTLVLSPALHTQLQRLQPGTGMLEIDRVGKLVGGHLLRTPVLGANQAVLVCAQPENMDLVVGQDLAAAYLEQKDLNHSFRLLETALLRIRKPKAIVAFE